ncbi:hypothetical protein HA052_21195 [Chromobacterium haemolyticum]|uniref:Salmonella invasion protein A N-terminal domain-containing protein n=1 Tax=Chromobacterium fluminis TaxID=3044269 RepID=A0ABX0LDT2_9NEIS|nr:hypothetical protein [Chromobacterium haemolyticum]NHR07709.1 hypothetical protein [Chromobacterium haemolyticum]
MPGLSGLSRAHSCPDLSALLNGPARPASALVRQLSEARSSDAAPPRRHSLADLASYKADYSRDSVGALFAASSQSQRLGELYQGSPNRYAKLEIAEFAKVYSQLSQQEGLNEQARQALDGLAQQYTEKILKDGLGEKSVFGPWTPRTDKHYQQRSKLEHKLAVMMERQCPGGVLQLGNDFMRREVVPFILSRVESHLGRQLDENTCQRLTELVDSAAMKAFEELRLRRGELIEQRGVSVGTLARDLDTVAILPQLLRSLLEGQGQGSKDPEQPEPVRADQPDPGPGSQPNPDPGPAGPGETPRPQEVHYHFNFNDNSQDNRQDNRRWDKRGDTYLGDVNKGNRHHGGAPSRLVTFLRMPAPQVARSQDLPKPQQATVSELMNTALGEEMLTAPTPGAAQAGKLEATVRQARLSPPAMPQSATLGGASSGVEQGTQTDAGQALRDAASQVTGALSELMNTVQGTQTDAGQALRDAASQVTGALSELMDTAQGTQTDAGQALRYAASQVTGALSELMNTAQGAQTDAGPRLRDAARQVSGALSELMNTALGEETLTVPTPGVAQAGKLEATARQARLDLPATPQSAILGGVPSGVEQGTQTDAGQTLHDAAGQVARELSGLVNSALAGHARQGFQPHNATVVDTGLRLNQAERKVADGLSKVLNSAAGLRVEGRKVTDVAAVRSAASQLVSNGAMPQIIQPLTARAKAEMPPAVAVGGEGPAALSPRFEPNTTDQRRRAFLQGMLNGATAATAAQDVESLQSARPDLEAAEPTTAYFQPVNMSEPTVKKAELRQNEALAQLSVNPSLMDGLRAASKPADSVPAELTSMRFQPVTMSKLGVKVAELKQNKALGQLSASQALMEGLRTALQPADSTQGEHWEAILDTVLPDDVLAQQAVLKQASLPEPIDTLRQVLNTHPQRLVLAEFAKRLRDQTNLCPSVSGGPYPLVGALLEGLGVSAKAPSRVITTVDGKYFDASGVKGAAQ